MELTELKNLITKLLTLPKPEPKEATIFSIGGRGHYENPTTDILAFFLDDNAAHGLGNIALEALLELLPLENTLEAHLCTIPSREVGTHSGRIDLLLESDEWIVVLENKIFHQQNNPFDDYSDFAQTRYPGKQVVLVVLSPNGEAPEGWYGISYPSLMGVLKEKLATAFIEQPLSKWLVLLREFILHLEQLMDQKNKIPEETSDFVLENLGDIKAIQQLKDQVIDDLRTEYQQGLQASFEDEVTSGVQHWHGFPALRFSLKSWESQSDVVLFMDGNEGKSFCLTTYVCMLSTPELHEGAKAYIDPEGHMEFWTEKTGSIAAFRTTLDYKDKPLIFRQIEKRMQILEAFEHNRARYEPKGQVQ